MWSWGYFCNKFEMICYEDMTERTKKLGFWKTEKCPPSMYIFEMGLRIVVIHWAKTV